MKKPFFFVNKVSNSTAEILIYGYIGEYEVNAGDFVRELRELEKEYANINVRINSGGGSVFEGFAMYNAVKNCKANVETFNDGVAASMGTVLLLSGRKIHMSKNARFMSHRASGGAYGSADELRQTAELLEGLENSICSVYAKRTGLTTDEAREKYMNGTDRWLSAEQALEEKLIDSIYDADSEIEVPANISNARELVELYGQTLNNRIDNFSNLNNMKSIQLPITAALMAILGIAENADANAVERAITNLSTTNTRLKGDNDALKATNKELQDKYDEVQNASTEKEVADILNQGEKDKKLTAELKAALATQYKGRPNELKDLVAKMPAYQSITDQLDKGKGDAKDKYANKTWDELHKAKLLESMRAEQPDAFKALYRETYKREYAGKM